MRTKHRKFGRDGQSTYATGATHAIKIGFSTIQVSKKDNKAHKMPGKLNGFLICRDSLDTGGNLVVDKDCMLRLGPEYDDKRIALAKEKELQSPVGILPWELHFVIPQDALKTPGGWEHPGTFREAYSCWNKDGLFCEGDGERASRKEEKGTRRDIECVPNGKEGAEPDTFCKFSLDGSCRHHSRLTLCLFVPDEKGPPEPLCQSLGWSARFRFDTTSEYNAIRVGQELDRAADRLQGRLAGITGVLVFARQSKRTGKGVGIVGQVMFNLSEPDIARREQELHNRFVEQHQAKLLEGPKVEESPPDPFATTREVNDWGLQEEPGDEEPVGTEEVIAAFSEPEPEPEDDAPEFIGPSLATEEQVVKIQEMAEAYSINLVPVLEQAEVLGVYDLTAEQAEKTIAWLKRKAAKP